jgi:hypothetical protein
MAAPFDPAQDVVSYMIFRTIAPQNAVPSGGPRLKRSGNDGVGKLILFLRAERRPLTEVVGEQGNQGPQQEAQ